MNFQTVFLILLFVTQTITDSKKVLWNDWSTWSACNVTCGNGFMIRTRLCSRKNNASELCIGNNTDIQKCFNDTTCEESWSSWSNWSTCSNTTGFGQKNRTRLCENKTSIEKCVGKNIEVRNCSKASSRDDLIFWNVTFDQTIERSLLSSVLELNIPEVTSDADYYIIEYFLPPYFTLTFDNPPNGFIKDDLARLKYKYLRKFSPKEKVIHNFAATFNKLDCSLPKFKMVIPIKFTFQNSEGKVLSLMKKYQKNVLCKTNYQSEVSRDKNALSESYGRGIYWDNESSIIYVCMNQHVSSAKTACYYSKNDGRLWKGLDILVGSIIGYHSITKVLYGIHRNQKTYLMLDKIHKKWLALTNDNFLEATKFERFSWKNLENNVAQSFSLGSEQWLSSSEGLFIRKREKDWALKVKWP
ncbi:uncharacterized protein LOC136080639 isoform X2 [Hydra vulgaris]|uniref:Uncharacterized protein LOC136080639 isoform X2 n=1 Tax=Hydra vulgaris TaxID=6087 RepID=A0ABM4BWQ0_HYDVU